MDDPSPDPPPGGHYFDPQPAAASRRRVARLSLPDLDLDLTTDRGVFSAHHVDPGTKLLLLEAPAPPAGALHLLDLGCGYGPIAVALAARAPQAVVWAVDVNERALALCAENAEAAGVGDRVRVVPPDGVPDDVRFAGMWSNPPVRVGKAAMHELLDRWLGRLAPEGKAWLVVQRHLGADSLARWLEDGGRPTRRVVSRSGFRVLEVGPVGVGA